MDTLTLIDFESGNLSLTEIVEMLSEMLEEQGLDNIDDRFKRMAKGYINKGVLDEDGNINYIKLNEEL